MIPSKELTPNEAQLLMSQLHDGELSPNDAIILQSYLERNPEAIDWIESLDTLDLATQERVVPIHRDTSIAAIHEAIGGEQSKRNAKLLHFPRLFRPLAAAAAVVTLGAATWLGLHTEAQASFEPNVVEFVSTDIPNATTYIIPDEESGWTVVWVDSETLDSDKNKG
ncbi:hypothetical protein [Pelagicoccus albus]|uniref:Uncharacterized protein n=1 Tax=Pelagicoccus albus TaxID=415222 RepID=A0A7X1E9X5_9BACT|nr:hypothetical protein [Pelagicoccus albus]MBC2607653.1 hypothetical protein [Pelagicoccus albus]